MGLFRGLKGDVMAGMSLSCGSIPSAGDTSTLNSILACSVQQHVAHPHAAFTCRYPLTRHISNLTVTRKGSVCDIIVTPPHLVIRLRLIQDTLWVLYSRFLETRACSTRRAIMLVNGKDPSIYRIYQQYCGAERVVPRPDTQAQSPFQYGRGHGLSGACDQAPYWFRRLRDNPANLL